VEIGIEIYGLEVHGYHGALEREQREGQTFLVDVTLVAHDAGVRSDKLSDTIDYTQVAARVHEVATQTRFNLIAAAIADAVVSSFDVSRVRVRVRKPEVELDHPVEFTAATVERSPR
jgi:dihydroneopterin aldolase